MAIKKSFYDCTVIVRCKATFLITLYIYIYIIYLCICTYPSGAGPISVSVHGINLFNPTGFVN